MSSSASDERSLLREVPNKPFIPFTHPSLRDGPVRDAAGSCSLLVTTCTNSGSCKRTDENLCNLLPCYLQVFKECLSNVPGVPNFKPRLRILSLDGGGVKGIMPAFILHQLEKELRDEVTRWQLAELAPKQDEDPAVEPLRPVLAAIKAANATEGEVLQGMFYFGPTYPTSATMPSLPRRPTLGLVVSGGQAPRIARGTINLAPSVNSSVAL